METSVETPRSLTGLWASALVPLPLAGRSAAEMTIVLRPRQASGAQGGRTEMGLALFLKA